MLTEKCTCETYLETLGEHKTREEARHIFYEFETSMRRLKNTAAAFQRDKED